MGVFASWHRLKLVSRLRGTWPVGFEMRNFFILKGTLLLLALFECCAHGTVQAGPLKHHRKLCNNNRDCFKKAICSVPESKRGQECPFKDRTGKCFTGVCSKPWVPPCNRKCGNGGPCGLIQLYFHSWKCHGLRRMSQLCFQICGNQDRRAKCQNAGRTRA